VILLSHSANQTEQLGIAVGSLLHRGAFMALFGQLGGGKTCFTRGVVTAISPDCAHLVASPTYAIMNEYAGQIPVYHFDFYRLATGNEILELGFDDYFQANGVCIAEWSERLGEMLPPDHLSVTFEHVEGDLRRIIFKACGTDYQELLVKLTAQLNMQEFL